MSGFGLRLEAGTLIRPSCYSGRRPGRQSICTAAGERFWLPSEPSPRGPASGPRAGSGRRASGIRIPRIQILDPSFARYRVASAKVERLATGMRWSEGPVWFGDGRYLLWSDIPNNRIMKWEESSGAVSVFRAAVEQSPTATRATARAGCSPASTTRDASRAPSTTARITVLAERFDGKPLNSPNDVVCRSDGSIWFTDPPFGILGYYEGHMAKPELPTNVYRLDPGTGRPHGRRRRHQPPQRPVLLAGRNEALRDRSRPDAAGDPRLRRDAAAAPGSPTAGR